MADGQTARRHVTVNADNLADEFDMVLQTRTIFGLRTAEANAVLDNLSNLTAAETAAVATFVDSQVYAGNWSSVEAFQLYETANFTRPNEAGEFEGSEEMADLARAFGFGD